MIEAQQLRDAELRRRSPQERLYMAIGRIAVVTHRMSELFLTGDAKVETGFDDRRRAWLRNLRSAFIRGRDKRELERLNSKLVELQSLRDALIHGAAALGPHWEGEIVECRISVAKTRYHRAARDYARRHPSSRGGWGLRWITETIIERGEGAVTVGYSLDQIEQRARDAGDLENGISHLNLIYMRLTKSGIAHEHRAQHEMEAASETEVHAKP